MTKAEADQTKAMVKSYFPSTPLLKVNFGRNAGGYIAQINIALATETPGEIEAEILDVIKQSIPYKKLINDCSLALGDMTIINKSLADELKQLKDCDSSGLLTLEEI